MATLAVTQPPSASNAGTSSSAIAQRNFLFVVCERTGISTGASDGRVSLALPVRRLKIRSLRFAEFEDVAVRLVMQALLENPRGMDVGRIGDDVARADELEACRHHFRLHGVGLAPMQGRRDGEARALLRDVVDDNVDAARLQALEHRLVER